jgi:hypothetical protein
MLDYARVFFSLKSANHKVRATLTPDECSYLTVSPILIIFSRTTWQARVLGCAVYALHHEAFLHYMECLLFANCELRSCAAPDASIFLQGMYHYAVPSSFPFLVQLCVLRAGKVAERITHWGAADQSLQAVSPSMWSPNEDAGTRILINAELNRI